MIYDKDAKTITFDTRRDADGVRLNDDPVILAAITRGANSRVGRIKRTPPRDEAQGLRFEKMAAGYKELARKAINGARATHITRDDEGQGRPEVRDNPDEIVLSGDEELGFAAFALMDVTSMPASTLSRVDEPDSRVAQMNDIVWAANLELCDLAVFR